MKYLLDTHILLWVIMTPKIISPKLFKILADTDNEIYISAVSFWEISLKFSLGKLELKNTSPEELINSAEKMGFRIIDLHADDAATLYKLETWHHRDPFDRILIWQAIQNKFTLISNDKFVKKYVSAGLRIYF